MICDVIFKMRILYISLIILLAGCSKEGQLIGELPVTDECLPKVQELLDTWENNYAGTSKKIYGEYYKYYQAGELDSPISGYIKVYGSGLDSPDTYMNTLVGKCVFMRFIKVDNDNLGYRGLIDDIKREVNENNKKEFFLRVDSKYIYLYANDRY